VKPDILHGFRMGPWLVEPLKGAITGPDGKSHHLQPKVMDVLVCLAEHADKPVTREALLDEVWGEYTVSDEPLTRAIGELRRALHDHRGDPTYIETIPKRGYRLIGTVLAIGADESPVGEAHQVRRPPFAVTSIGMLILISGLVIWQFDSFNSLAPGPGQGAGILPNSIAVLPFESCSNDEDSELLTERIADEVRSKLAQIDDVNVSASTSQKYSVVAKRSSFVFWEAGVAPEEIGRALNVRYLLSAEICQQDNTITISVSLIDDRGYLKEARNIKLVTVDEITLTENIAAAVVDVVAPWLGAPPPTVATSVVDIEAREKMLIARQHLAHGNVEKAKTALDSALQIQPDFAEALFVLATLDLRGLDVDQRIGLEDAKKRGEEALGHALGHFLIDPTSFETNFVVGEILASLAEWEHNLVWRDDRPFDLEPVRTKYAEAEIYLVAAVKANPSSSRAADLLADAVAKQGRQDEALDIRLAAQRTDPFNLDLNWKIALRWAASGRYREAIELLQRFEQLPITSVQAWNKQLELMQIHGYWADQCETLIRLLQNHPDIAAHGQIRFQISWFIGDLLHLGLYDEAEAWRARLSVDDLPEWGRLYAERFYLWGMGNQQELTRRTRGRLADMTEEEFLDPWYNLPMNWAWDIAAGGDIERAITLSEMLENAPTLYIERDILPSLLLARLYHLADRQNDAEPLLDRLAKRLESEYASGVRHPESLFRLAEVYALQERNESAINALQMAVDAHWRMPWWNLPWNTDLNGLATDPRIAALRRVVEEDLDAQAKRISAMLAEHDVDDLLAPLAR